MYCCVSLAFVVPYCNVGWLRLFWVPSTVQHQIPKFEEELQYCKGFIQETKTIIFGWHHNCPHLVHSFLLSARSWKRSRCSCWSSWRLKALRWQRNRKMEMRFGRGTGPWRSLRRTGCCIPHLQYRWYCMYSTVLYPFQSRFPNISIQYCTYRIYCIYCTVCFLFIPFALAKSFSSMFLYSNCTVRYVYCRFQLAQRPTVQNLWHTLANEKEERRTYQKRYERMLSMRWVLGVQHSTWPNKCRHNTKSTVM